MAAKKPKHVHGPSEDASAPPNWLAIVTGLMSILNRIADRFGMGLAVLLLLLGVVWFFGDGATRNDFVRHLLFGEVSNAQSTRLLFLFLVLDGVIGLTAGVRYFWGERVEMRRLAAEKAKWQERALGVPLHHTDVHEEGESR